MLLIKNVSLNGGITMELINEFLMYLIKFAALGLIACLGVICGIKHKKNKLAKEAAVSEEASGEKA